jgi:GGDEF domain-containing protein
MFKLNASQLTNEMLQQYRTDRAYGCYTRNCLEMEIWPAVAKRVRFVAFCDVDQMHQANELYGYTGVDKRIKRAINTGRESDIAVARWYSGDELVFLVLDGPRMGDPFQFTERIQARLRRGGLSATFGIVEVRPHEVRSPQMAVRRAAKLVQKAKQAGRRASINLEQKLNAPANTSSPQSALGWLGRLVAMLW